MKEPRINLKLAVAVRHSDNHDTAFREVLHTICQQRAWLRHVLQDFCENNYVEFFSPQFRDITAHECGIWEFFRQLLRVFDGARVYIYARDLKPALRQRQSEH